MPLFQQPPPSCDAVPTRADDAVLYFISFGVLSLLVSLAAISGSIPPDPTVHWPGHQWIYFMKRLHVIMSIGCFLMEVCASFFSLFALHRTLAGGFDMRASSTAELLVRELEFEFVAVSSYFFGGAVLLMGPVGIRCFCMVQQGLRSDFLAASVCCLIAGAVLLILSFFNAHLEAYPFDSYEQVLGRFIELSFERCAGGGRAAVIMVSAWTLQCVSVVLALLSLVETFPQIYFAGLDDDAPDGAAPPSRPASSAAAASPAAAERYEGVHRSARAAEIDALAPPSLAAGVPPRAPSPMALPTPPWQAALDAAGAADGRAPVRLAASHLLPSAGRAVGGLGKRVGSLGSLPESLTESVNSLDTNAVD